MGRSGPRTKVPHSGSDSSPTPGRLFPPRLSGLPQLRAPSGPSTWARPSWSQAMFVTERSSRCCTFLVGSDLPRGTQGISSSEEPQIFFPELPPSCPAQGAACFRSAPRALRSPGRGRKAARIPRWRGSSAPGGAAGRGGGRKLHPGHLTRSPSPAQGASGNEVSAGPTLGPHLAGTGPAFTCRPAGGWGV